MQDIIDKLGVSVVVHILMGQGSRSKDSIGDSCGDIIDKQDIRA